MWPDAADRQWPSAAMASSRPPITSLSCALSSWTVMSMSCVARGAPRTATACAPNTNQPSLRSSRTFATAASVSPSADIDRTFEECADTHVVVEVRSTGRIIRPPWDGLPGRFVELDGEPDLFLDGSPRSLVAGEPLRRPPIPIRIAFEVLGVETRHGHTVAPDAAPGCRLSPWSSSRQPSASASPGMQRSAPLQNTSSSQSALTSQPVTDVSPPPSRVPPSSPPSVRRATRLGAPALVAALGPLRRLEATRAEALREVAKRSLAAERAM